MPPAGERKPGSSDLPHRDVPTIAGTPGALRRLVSGWRRRGETVALVPTMGALHAGHLALVAAARTRADRTVVSIFVNPAQFSPSEDLDRYPRTFEADLALLGENAIDAVYAPGSADIYPPGFQTRIVPSGSALAGLEDAARPHFFGGVATVVAKLLLQCLPDAAVFGEKDYQQLQVVKALVRDLDIPVEIVPVATVRDPDGLALSSRNRFLSADERRRAVTLHQALAAAAQEIRAGAPIETTLAQAGEAIASVGAELDYLAARHADTLQSITTLEEGPLRLLVAVRLGLVRLIDNVEV